MAKVVHHLLLILVLFLLSCGFPHRGEGGGDAEGWESGVIVYVELEGGFYGIVGDRGERYYPIDLGESYKVDGMRVKFRYERVNVVTTAMWGIPVRIIEIAEVKGER
jgi:hypothetical protein